MKILGVNISHDATVAQMTDGVVDFLFEEERHRREKYWTPKIYKNDDGSQTGDELLTIVHRGIERPDELVFSSFDRRVISIEWNMSEDVTITRLQYMQIAEDFAKEQLTKERLDQLRDKYSQYFKFEMGCEEDDLTICDAIANQFGMTPEEYHYEVNHHIHHADCAYHLSQFIKDEEDAVVVVWDGGGCNAYMDTHPNYQEIETIYRCSPDDTVKQWQKLSNSRFVSELGSSCDALQEDAFGCRDDLETTIDGVELVFTSRPSNGMNFSNLSYALGCDEEGRAAGKVMGLASYSTDKPWGNVYSKHSIAQQLELDSFESACKTIQKAIDLNPDCKNIILSGGFSLNCTNNYKYLERFPKYQIYIDPVPHDGGTAIGACVWLERQIRKGQETNEKGEE
jgi:predicted NodU family carbamoyl transferase